MPNPLRSLTHVKPRHVHVHVHVCTQRTAAHTCAGAPLTMCTLGEGYTQKQQAFMALLELPMASFGLYPLRHTRQRRGVSNLTRYTTALATLLIQLMCLV